jgi:hypothetical protein
VRSSSTSLCASLIPSAGRTPEEDISLGLQPEHGTYRKDSDTNLVSLLDGSAKFGQPKEQSKSSDETLAQALEGEEPRDTGGQEGDEEGGEHIELGREEAIRIPGECPNCSHPGVTLTALTDIPHFKEVIIMAFTCSQCGYKNSEVKGGGAVPTYGTEVTLRVTSAEDLKR